MNEELLKMKNNVETLKQDRLRDQKTTNKLDEQNKILKMNIESYISSIGNFSSNKLSSTNQVI